MMMMMVMVLGIQHRIRHKFDWFDFGHFLLQHRLAFQRLFLLSLGVLLLETATTTQERSIVEHVVRIRIESPVAALARFLVIPSHLHEALVQAEIVAD